MFWWIRVYPRLCRPSHLRHIHEALKDSAEISSHIVESKKKRSSFFSFRKCHLGKHYYHVIMPRVWNIHMWYVLPQGYLFNVWNIKYFSSTRHKKTKRETEKRKIDIKRHFHDLEVLRLQNKKRLSMQTTCVVMCSLCFFSKKSFFCFYVNRFVRK
jgi:hypothetical protein